MRAVLAFEPDPRQAAALRLVVKDRVGANLVLAESKDAALAAIRSAVPDLILLTALISPRDETEIADLIRELDGAEHTQTLTIPLLDLGTSRPVKKKKRGLLSALTGETAEPSAPSGCDPAVFADEVANYLLQAEHARAEAALSRERRARKPRRKKRDVVDEGTPETAAGAGSSNYWSWDTPLEAPAPVVETLSPAPEAPRTAVAAPDGLAEGALDAAPAGPSSWDNPWDVFAPSIWKEPSPGQHTYLDDHIIPGPDPFVASPSETVEALLEHPAPATAADQLASTPNQRADLVRPDPEPVVDAPMVATEPSAAFRAFEQPAVPVAEPASEPEQRIHPDSEIVKAKLPTRAESGALLALQADVARLRQQRASTAATLVAAKAAQERAARAASEAAAHAKREADRRADEAADRAREEARAERRARELAEKRAQEEAQRRAEAEKRARHEAQRLAKEAADRAREEAGARAREEAAAERKAREQAERQARDEAERRVEAERKGREEAERQAAAERRAREQAERRAKEETTRLEREARERQAHAEAERKAREAAEAHAAAERKAREQAARLAREAETRAREEAEAERRARLQAQQRAEAESQAREQAERAAEAARPLAQPARKATPVRKSRKAAPEPRRAKEDTGPRAIQDEWGLYDPHAAGFEALFAKLESIENGETAEQDEPAPPPRAPRPLAMWAFQFEPVPEPPAVLPTKGRDEFRALVSQFSIPHAVAAVSYATGARIRRVRVTAVSTRRSRSETDPRVVILSRKLLKAARRQTATERLTARR